MYLFGSFGIAGPSHTLILINGDECLPNSFSPYELLCSQRVLEFAGITTTLPANSIKIAVNVIGWRYRSTLNTLRLVFQTQVSDPPAAVDCGDTVDDIGDINYLKVVKGNVTFYGHFLSVGMSDGRRTYSKNEVINHTTNGLANIGINMPQCSECLIDPSFSVLISTTFPSKSCESKSKTWLIATVVSIVGVVVIAASLTIFMVIKKRMRQIKEPLSNVYINTVTMGSGYTNGIDWSFKSKTLDTVSMESVTLTRQSYTFDLESFPQLKMIRLISLPSTIFKSVNFVFNSTQIQTITISENIPKNITLINCDNLLTLNAPYTSHLSPLNLKVMPKLKTVTYSDLSNSNVTLDDSPPLEHLILTNTRLTQFPPESWFKNQSTVYLSNNLIQGQVPNYKTFPWDLNLNGNTGITGEIPEMYCATTLKPLKNLNFTSAPECWNLGALFGDTSTNIRSKVRNTVAVFMNGNQLNGNATVVFSSSIQFNITWITDTRYQMVWVSRLME
eukprot:gene6611-7682_t